MNAETGFGLDERQMLLEIEREKAEDPKPILLHGVIVTPPTCPRVAVSFSGFFYAKCSLFPFSLKSCFFFNSEQARLSNH